MQEAEARRKALSDLFKARRRAKETGLERTKAGEAELREANEDLARLEELQSEVRCRSHITPLSTVSEPLKQWASF